MIIGNGTKMGTFDVRIGDVGIFRSVPSDKLRWPRVKSREEGTTTPTPAAMEEPLSVGDFVKYRGPGPMVNISDPSTWVPCMIVGEGEVPYTFHLGTTSGFVF